MMLQHMYNNDSHSPASVAVFLIFSYTSGETSFVYNAHNYDSLLKSSSQYYYLNNGLTYERRG